MSDKYRQGGKAAADYADRDFCVPAERQLRGFGNTKRQKRTDHVHPAVYPKLEKGLVFRMHYFEAIPQAHDTCEAGTTDDELGRAVAVRN